MLHPKPLPVGAVVAVQAGLGLHSGKAGGLKLLGSPRVEG